MLHVAASAVRECIKEFIIRSLPADLFDEHRIVILEFALSTCPLLT